MARVACGIPANFSFISRHETKTDFIVMLINDREFVAQKVQAVICLLKWDYQGNGKLSFLFANLNFNFPLP